MKPGARVQATIDLYSDWESTRFPADRLMAQYFKQRRYIGSKDKAAISETFYGVLRNRLSLLTQLEKQGLPQKPTFIIAAFLSMQGEPLESLFTGERFCPSKLDSTLVNALSELKKAKLSMHEQNNIPLWIFEKLEAYYEDDLDRELSAINQQATTDVRTNSIKTDRDSLLSVFESLELPARAGELSDQAIVFSKREALFNLPEFKRGHFEIQDQGSQLLAELTRVQAGQRVVDFCAGAGGKTLALAAMMQNKGSIWACDVHAKRLAQFDKRKKRAGVDNVRVQLLSSERDKWVKQHAAKADVVFIDAPCSGTGTWRRSPDARWNLTEQGLAELVQLQAAILASAKRLVKPGGVLFYATCSLLVEENEDQSRGFLQSNCDFVAEPILLTDSLNEHAERIHWDQHEFRCSPGLSGTDGFYLAKFRRSNSSV